MIGIILLFIGAGVSVINADFNNQYDINYNSAKITFIIDGFGILSIEFDGEFYRDNQTVEVNIGEYSLKVGLYIRGAVFDGWVGSDNITIEDPKLINTTVYVTGDGIITLRCHYRARYKIINNLLLEFFQKQNAENGENNSENHQNCYTARLLMWYWDKCCIRRA